MVKLFIDWRMQLLATVLVLLSGCVAVPTVTPSRSAEAFRLEPKDEGLLIASAVVNTGEVGQLLTIRLQRLDAPLPPGKKPEHMAPPEYTLSNAIVGKLRDQSLFIGSVPEGRYKVIELSFGGKFMDLRNGSLLSEIRVEAGKSTDLGMIVVTAANLRVLAGRSKVFVSSRTLIERFYPNDGLLMQAQFGGWELPIPQEDVAEEFALAYTQGISTITETKSGDVVAGTRLGTVLTRNSEGRWRVLARTGNYDAVTFVAPYPQYAEDAVLALTDAGDAYLVSGGKISKIALGNLPAGRIFFIDSNPQGSRWMVGVAHNGKAELLTANSLINGQWAPVYADDISFSAWSGGRNAWAAKSPTGVVFASSIHPEVRCFDYASEQWQSIAVPDKRTVIDLKVNPVTGMVGLLTSPGGGFAGVFAKSHLAGHCGSAWQTIKTPYSVEVGAPVGLNDGSVAVMGGVFGDEGFYASADNGNTWSKRSSERVLSDYFYQTARNGLFLVSKGMYGFEFISSSTDGGVTWRTELSSINPALLKAQENRQDKPKQDNPKQEKVQ